MLRLIQLTVSSERPRRNRLFHLSRGWLILTAALATLTTPAVADRVLMDPPPVPSGGSRAEVVSLGKPIWVEIGESVSGLPAPPLMQSDGGGDKLEAVTPFVTPPPTVQWDAITQTLATGVRPPDNNLAVGTGAGAAGRVVEVTNQSVQIFNKTGVPVTGPTLLATVFPPSAIGTFVFDPKILFDQASGRFFIVALEVGFGGGTCTSALFMSRIRIAVSTTGTPNNLGPDWTRLSGNGLVVIGGNTTWSDYPSIGADSDSVFVTTNQFDAVCTYRGANVRVFSKAALLAGAYAFQDVTFDNAVTTGTFTIQPAHVYGATDNGGFYLISRLGPAAYRLYNIMGDPGAPVATTGLFAWTSGAFPADTTADQCTVATPDLDTLATRVQNAVYRNGRLWCTLTSDPDGDGQTEVVWEQIVTNSFPTAAPAIAQAGFINGGGTPNPWTFMPSINVNAAGDAVISFTQSSATQCPAVMAASRLNADPPGTFQAPVAARASASFYDSVSAVANDRWGDYSGVAVDPTDQCFWIVNEFSAFTAVNASRWGTHIAKFCTSTEGACCFGATTCGNRTAAACATQGGTFRGVGSKCPTQNVRSALHQNGPIVHWVNPAVNCNNITPLASFGVGSDCCSAHPTAGCDTLTCASSVCQLLPHCCQVGWDQGCAQTAESVCGGLCNAGGCNQGYKIDAWITPSDVDHRTCDPSPPIPPGFFGPGSDPFIGTICYQGQPLGPTPYGDFALADTLVQRAFDPFDRCAAPPAPDISIPIQIVALNLVSLQPITVTFNGGQNPTPWNVKLDLSTVPAPQGTMTIRKTHCNGGTWDSALPVQPRFTFTQAANPLNIRVLDTGQDGYPPVILQTGPTMPWVSDLDPNLYLAGAECTNFHPGIEDPNPSSSCDCNVNGVRDECDVTTGGYPDCNQNAKPDQCDPDLDLDTLPDDCDNCSAFFNPLQENSDIDRFGDACDLCPFLTERIEGDHDGDKVRDVSNLDFPLGDNCPCVSNFSQQDTDGDGTGDACESAPAGSIQTSLRVTKSLGSITLTWSRSCMDSDNDYGIYEGTIASPFGDDFPIACSTLGSTSYTLAPPARNTFYLIVPSSNGAIEGSYGLSTAGPRPPSATPCHPQALGPCP